MTCRLTVRDGEILGIVGPNGSGKTTLFNVISGLYRPSAGQVRLDGQAISGAPPHRVSQLGVARTFQHLRLFRNLTVRRTCWSPWTAPAPGGAGGTSAGRSGCGGTTAR